MSYTRYNESGHYVYGSEKGVYFNGYTVDEEAVNVMIYDLYDSLKRGDNDFWERYHHGRRVIDNWLYNRMRVHKYDELSNDLKEVSTEISALAGEIWREHYTPIIGAEQVEYMLEKFQSPEQIRSDAKGNGYIYFTAKLNTDRRLIGYCGVQPRGDHLFISKIYVHRDFRGRLIARSLLNEVYALCRWELNLDKVRLTVNKSNADAIEIYEKIGFRNIDEVKTDIGDGYYMDDYVMEKQLVWPDKPEDEFEKVERSHELLEELKKSADEYRLTQSEL
jgi:ribosomal protein S18 acetylase RimI-like enzyme